MDSMTETYKAMMAIKQIDMLYDQIEQIKANTFIEPHVKKLKINIKLIYVDLILTKNKN